MPECSAGWEPPPGSICRFIRPVKMKVDQSQVRLFVPETHWYRFEDTMTRVKDEWDLRAGQYAYETKKLEKYKDVPA